MMLPGRMYDLNAHLIYKVVIIRLKFLITSFESRNYQFESHNYDFNYEFENISLKS